MAKAGNSSDMAKGTGATFSGSTPGSRGLGSVNSSIGQAASTGRKNPSGVGWPGEMDARSQNSDRQQSAP